MPFFREPYQEEEDDYWSAPAPPKTLHEMMETARWYHACGWWLSAHRLIDEIARSIENGDDPELNYEETRFSNG